MNEFEDVFADNHTLKPMKGDPMKIHLQNDYEPYRISAARQVPFAYREKVKDKLDEML